MGSDTTCRSRDSSPHEEPQAGERQFVRSECGYDADNHTEVMLHLLIDTEEKPYVCKYC
ncbi:hypothetical protein V5799_033832, partial [Amblyomma americanum]